MITRSFIAFVSTFVAVSGLMAQKIAHEFPVDRYVDVGSGEVLRETGYLGVDGSYRSGSAQLGTQQYWGFAPAVLAAVDGRMVLPTVGWIDAVAGNWGWSTENFSYDASGPAYLFDRGEFHDVLVKGDEEKPRLLNISTRAFVPANDALIVGTVVEGGPVTLLVRAVGPTLEKYGVTKPLADPKIQVVQILGSGNQALGSNDNWDESDTELAAAIASVGAGPLNSGSKDAILLVTLQPGLYTFVITAPEGQSGVALADAFLVPGSTGRLINLSTRGHVGIGENSMIAGFVVDPASPTARRRVILRGVGPELSAYGVTGTVPDPAITLHDVNGPIATNDNASLPDVRLAKHVGAFGLTENFDPDTTAYTSEGFPAGTTSSILVRSMASGVYTMIMSAKDDKTGTGLVELYEY